MRLAPGGSQLVRLHKSEWPGADLPRRIHHFDRQTTVQATYAAAEKRPGIRRQRNVGTEPESPQ